MSESPDLKEAAATEDLEDISDEEEIDLSDALSDIESAPSSPTLSVASPQLPNQCRPCRLIFEDMVSHDYHTASSEQHNLAVAGFKPSSGKFYCFLCWQGFRDSCNLSDHYATTEHESKVKDAKVKAICPIEDRKRRSSKSSSEEKSKRPKTGSQMPDVVPSDLGGVKRCEKDEWICESCNVVFARYVCAKAHARSPNHLSVMESRFPALERSTGHQSKDELHYCFSCWFAFSNSSELLKHYQTSRHLTTLKRLGILRINRTEPQSSSNTEELIVLDEVRGSDDEEFDQVSSDEDVLAAANSPQLEDVNSEEEGFDDVSEDDEAKISGPLPPVPPPPKISENKLLAKEELLSGISPVRASKSNVTLS